jgi:hypothetical protein
MKVVQETSRELKLKQVNWMPWYGHLLLWPTAALCLLMSITGQTATFTCQRSTGQCELNNSTINNPEKRTIAIEKVKNFDLVATDSTSDSPDTQIKIITDDGEFNVGLDGNYADRDEAAGKLAWFFEDQTAKYIKLHNSTNGFAQGAGATGWGLLGLAFLLRKKSTALFDRDTDRCVIDSSRFFGLIKGRRDVCEFRDIIGVNRSSSLKTSADRILLERPNLGGFFLTDAAMKNPAAEMNAVQTIRKFLRIKDPQQPVPEQTTYTEEGVGYEESYYSSESTESYSSEPVDSTPKDSSSDSNPYS